MGQEKFLPEIDFGVSGGVNLTSSQFGTSFSNQPFKTQLWPRNNFGLAIRYLTEKNLGLQLEFNYSEQGWKQDFSDPDASAEQQSFLNSLEYHRALNYIDIPILTHIYFGGTVRGIINLGPQISFLVNEKEHLNDALISYLASGEVGAYVSTAQYYKRVDHKFGYGLTGGAGIEFHTKFGQLIIEGRYFYGLSDFFRNGKSESFQQSQNRNIIIKSTLMFKVF